MLPAFRQYADIIRGYRVSKFERVGDSFRLRAKAELRDSSTLYIRETIISNEKRKYAYHWQDEDGNLIIRWDNAPDWDVETFPHHKHIRDQRNVHPSYERTLEQVLGIIAQELRE